MADYFDQLTNDSNGITGDFTIERARELRDAIIYTKSAIISLKREKDLLVKRIEPLEKELGLLRSSEFNEDLIRMKASPIFGLF